MKTMRLVLYVLAMCQETFSPAIPVQPNNQPCFCPFPPDNSTEVDLSRCCLSTVPKELNEMRNLTSINLSYNDIIQLDSHSFTNFYTLTTVNLSHNNDLSTLDEKCFLNSTSIEIIDFSYNLVGIKAESLMCMTRLNTVIYLNRRDCEDLQKRVWELGMNITFICKRPQQTEVNNTITTSDTSQETSQGHGTTHSSMQDTKETGKPTETTPTVNITITSKNETTPMIESTPEVPKKQDFSGLQIFYVLVGIILGIIIYIKRRWIMERLDRYRNTPNAENGRIVPSTAENTDTEEEGSNIDLAPTENPEQC